MLEEDSQPKVSDLNFWVLPKIVQKDVSVLDVAVDDLLHMDVL